MTTLAFDARFGNLTSLTDPNTQLTTYNYDVFGRLTKTTGPLDRDSQYGSITRFYHDFGNPAAQGILTYRTTQHGTGNVVWSDQLFDGQGRTFLARSAGPGIQTILSETTFDSRGLVASRSAGFGARVTAAWAKAIRSAGSVPLYSAAWTNNESLAVARKLGLGAYASFWSISNGTTEVPTGIEP